MKSNGRARRVHAFHEVHTWHISIFLDLSQMYLPHKKSFWHSFNIPFASVKMRYHGVFFPQKCPWSSCELTTTPHGYINHLQVTERNLHHNTHNTNATKTPSPNGVFLHTSIWHSYQRLSPSKWRLTADVTILVTSRLHWHVITNNKPPKPIINIPIITGRS